MTETLNPEVVAANANSYFQAVGGQPASLANQALANAVSFQQGMNTIFAALVGKIGETIVTMDVGEAAGVAPIGQIAAKIAGKTPPVTVGS